MRRATLSAAVFADYTVVKEQGMTEMLYGHQSTMLQVKIAAVNKGSERHSKHTM